MYHCRLIVGKGSTVARASLRSSQTSVPTRSQRLHHRLFECELFGYPAAATRVAVRL